MAIINNPNIILASILYIKKSTRVLNTAEIDFQFQVTGFPGRSPHYGMFHYVLICIFLATYKSYHFDSLTENDTYFFNYYHPIWDLAKISLQILAMEPIKIRGLNM